MFSFAERSCCFKNIPKSENMSKPGFCSYWHSSSVPPTLSAPMVLSGDEANSNFHVPLRSLVRLDEMSKTEQPKPSSCNASVPSTEICFAFSNGRSSQSFLSRSSSTFNKYLWAWRGSLLVNQPLCLWYHSWSPQALGFSYSPRSCWDSNPKSLRRREICVRAPCLEVEVLRQRRDNVKTCWDILCLTTYFWNASC